MTPASARKARGASDRIPFRVRPMLATLVDEPFHRPGWVYEEKYDGYRILAYKEGREVTLLSRNAKDRTETFSEIARAIASAIVPREKPKGATRESAQASHPARARPTGRERSAASRRLAKKRRSAGRTARPRISTARTHATMSRTHKSL